MKAIVYLTFNGNCREAINFYKEVFEIPEVKILPYSDMPDNPEFPMPENIKNYVAHADIVVGETIISCADSFPGVPYNETTSDMISVCLTGINSVKAEEIYNKLMVSGKEIMPLGETFWSPAYGLLVDKYGVKWQINAEK